MRHWLRTECPRRDAGSRRGREGAMEDVPRSRSAGKKPVCLTVPRDTFYSAVQGILAPSAEAT